ncbi:MAG: VWA domain-containing protein [Candidatus Omnitrophica bacterium]|nr:VWA domain-containing protein [Candidatus Omnitrophota bacterium]
MKKVIVVLILIVGMVSFCGQSISYAYKEYRDMEIERVEGDNNLSPYFYIPSTDAIDSLPLLKTDAKVNIAGVIADVELTQVYKNQGEKTIEAVYVFPMGMKSAIHAMRMKVADRITEANIEEKQAAQQIYEQAKNQGKTASLLQQERPNVFQMKAANIMPGDVVEVTVEYTELLVPQKGIYEFVYPTVVGPRYAGETQDEEKKNNKWINTPYHNENENPKYSLYLTVKVNAGIPISDIWVKSHDVKIIKDNSNAEILLHPRETQAGNRDFILRYTLKGKEIQTGLLLYPTSDENYFLLMAQPPERVVLNDLPAREYTFIVDVSGSMHGFPLDVSKTLIKKILSNLRTKDYFNIMFFSGGSNVLSEYPLQATEQNISSAISMLESQQGGGGTNILAALNKILALEKKEGLSRTVVIATDGYVSVEKQTFDLIRKNLNTANVFTFGIGSSVNRYLLEGMARAGSGEPFIVINKDETEKEANKFFEYVRAPLLTDIEIKSQGFEMYDVEPVNVPDLFAQKPLIIFGKYKTACGKIIISGKTAQGNYETKIKVGKAYENNENSALRYLWAREKIARLSDYGQAGVDVKQQVTELGLKYSLMSEYTSFIAVDKVIRDTGEVVTVKQPLALPQGVSNYAVGDVKRCAKMPISLGFNQPGVNGSLRLEEAEEKSASDLMLTVKESFTKDEEAKVQSALSVYLTGGRFTSEVTMAEVKQLITPLKTKLAKLLASGEIKSIKIELTIKKGKVFKITIKEYTGKECREKDIANILKSIRFKNSVTDTIEIELLVR